MSIINRIDLRDSDFSNFIHKLKNSGKFIHDTVESDVSKILENIRNYGNSALLDYTKRFDGFSPSSLEALEVKKEDCLLTLSSIPDSQRRALELAASRIRSYHEHQLEKTWTYVDNCGSILGQKVTPIDRVGLYVPGGKAAYPSSVLMSAIPAKIAGVRELIMVSPTPLGKQNKTVLAAAAVCEIDRVFSVGGAQSIGALAYGTTIIPSVDKIVGPGNSYVSSAKRQVFGSVGIDMLAGPTEILIISDGKVPADWIALDLLAQAEHDQKAQSILLCPDSGFIDKVDNSIVNMIDSIPRSRIIRDSLSDRGFLVQVKDLQQAFSIVNAISPEHLEIATENPEIWLDYVHHAGAIFMGRFSSEAFGDYCAGPSHVLPTSSTARFSSPLGVYDFQKRSSLIHMSSQGAKELAEISSELAFCEGLHAHALSAQCRIDNNS